MRWFRLMRAGAMLAGVLGVAGWLLVNLAGADFNVRRAIAEGIGLERRHWIIAFVSLPLNPPPETADLVPIAHADDPPYAINVFLEQEVEAEKVRQSLALIRDAGFRFVKQQLVWAEIERPVKGRFEDPLAPNGDAWAKYDRIVEFAAAAGIEVIFRIDTTPSWARPGRDKLETPPDRVEDFADFVATVVDRYRGRVRYYQIWNEPNLAFEWGNQPPDAAAYAALLRAGYLAAKRADPNAIVVSAALAPTIEISERAISDIVYLEQLYAAGAGPYFDVLGANAYGLRHGPDDRRLAMASDMNFSRPVLLRALMVRHGDAAKPILASEMGWVALPPDFGEEPRYGAVSRLTQAAYTVRAYQRAQEEWPWMGVMALWHFRLVQPHDRMQQHYYFNVVDQQFQPYPVYYAMQALTREPPALFRGYHKPTHWAVTRSGDWTVVEDARATLGRWLVGQPGATLRFTAVGNDLRIFTDADPAGRLEVRIDRGSPLVPGLRREAGATVLGSGQAAGGRESIALAPDYGRWHPERHEIELRVVGGPVAVDGIRIDAPTPYQTFWEAAARFALGLVGLASWYVRRRWAKANGPIMRAATVRARDEVPA